MKIQVDNVEIRFSHMQIMANKVSYQRHFQEKAGNIPQSGMTDCIRRQPDSPMHRTSAPFPGDKPLANPANPHEMVKRQPAVTWI